MAISKHLKYIFAFGELQEDMVIPKMETTTQYALSFLPIVYAYVKEKIGWVSEDHVKLWKYEF